MGRAIICGKGLSKALRRCFAAGCRLLLTAARSLYTLQS